MNERGAIATLTLILAPVMLLAGGLAIDGGNILAAKREAAAAADVAARAGAQALDTERLRAGAGPVLDPQAATAAARSALAAGGHEGSVTVHGPRVTVTVQITTSLYVLGLAGLGSRTVSAQGTAEAVRGVSEADAP